MKKKQVYSIALFVITLIFLNVDIFNHINFVEQLIGKYIYPLDDSYIHLAISKNLTEYNVWGITKYEFSSTSSSPFFTLIISFLMHFFGNNDLIPLYFNLIIANLLLVITYLNFKEKLLELFIIFWGYLFFVLLKTQVLSGMEHMLQIFLISLSWIYFYKWFESNFSKKSCRNIFLLVMPFLCITRYESLFYITLIILLLFYKKQYKITVISTLLAFIPLIIFGLISIQKGGYFFPNSVLAKGNYTLTNPSLIYRFLKKHITFCYYISIISFLILITLIYFYRTIKKNLTKDYLITIFNKNLTNLVIIFTIIAHLLFARIGWLYRYEAYLITLILLTVAFNIDKIKKKLKPSYMFFLLILSSFFLFKSLKRYQESNELLKYANKNIFDQQIQMSKFIGKYFNKSTIVANDIGAISYYSNIKLHDLVGLGSTDILAYKLRNNPKDYENYVNNLNYDIMLIYDSWFTDYNLKNKKKVATLYLKNNLICGGSQVSFYIPSNSKQELYTYKSLIEFKKNLPKDIILKIY